MNVIGEVSSTVIGPAQAADAPALGVLGALLMEMHYGFDRQRFIQPTERTPELYANFLDKQRQRPDAFVLVAKSRHVIVGYAYSTLEGSDYMALRGPAGVLHDLVVDPSCRRQGIGRSLVEAVRGDLAAAGAPRLVLSTAARNGDAQRLFTTLGFRPTMIEMTCDIEEIPPV